MAQVINVALYGQGTRNSRLRAEYISCDHAQECSLYKSGQCFNVTVPFGRSCKKGHVQSVDGGINRSKSYDRVWSAAKSNPEYHKLQYPNYALISKVGEEALLSVHYVNIEWEDEQFRVKDPGFSDGYPTAVPCEVLTPDNIHKIVKFRPNSLMGGRIEKYATTTVPNFLHQLSVQFPDKYDAYIRAYPESAEIKPNWIGRRAKLCTCNRALTYKEGGNIWRFDGDDLVCDKRCSAFNPFTGKPVEMRVKVTEDMFVDITDNDQVLPETEFL